jgi:hypothetical protein
MPLLQSSWREEWREEWHPTIEPCNVSKVETAAVPMEWGFAGFARKRPQGRRFGESTFDYVTSFFVQSQAYRKDSTKITTKQDYMCPTVF